jgi:hypothetical protein
MSQVECEVFHRIACMSSLHPQLRRQNRQLFLFQEADVPDPICCLRLSKPATRIHRGLQVSQLHPEVLRFWRHAKGQHLSYCTLLYQSVL